MRKDEIQTYPEMILSEGKSEDELSTQGNTERLWIYIPSLFSFARKNLVWTLVQHGMSAEVQHLRLQHPAQILQKWRDRFYHSVTYYPRASLPIERLFSLIR